MGWLDDVGRGDFGESSEGCEGCQERQLSGSRMCSRSSLAVCVRLNGRGRAPPVRLELRALTTDNSHRSSLAISLAGCLSTADRLTEWIRSGQEGGTLRSTRRLFVIACTQLQGLPVRYKSSLAFVAGYSYQPVSRGHILHTRFSVQYLI